MPHYQPSLLSIFLAIFAFFGWPASATDSAGDPDPDYAMYEYVTCAVYFRMVAGSMSRQYGRNLESLAAIEQEKMNQAMALGRTAAVREFGDDMAEEMFQSEWRAILADMTNEINRNYDNVGRLKARYDIRCEKMLKDKPVANTDP